MPLDFIQGGNLFKCTNGEYISVLSLDDGIVDCVSTNATDERECEHRYTLSLNICKSFTQRKNKKLRSFSAFLSEFNDFVEFSVNEQVFRYDDHMRPMLINGSKLAYPTEITQKFSHDTNKFLCKSGFEIDILLVNDLVSDCGPENDDEFILASQAKGLKFLCSVQGQLPCFNGHNKCYNIF